MFPYENNFYQKTVNNILSTDGEDTVPSLLWTDAWECDNYSSIVCYCTCWCTHLVSLRPLTPVSIFSKCSTFSISWLLSCTDNIFILKNSYFLLSFWKHKWPAISGNCNFFQLHFHKNIMYSTFTYNWICKS